MRTPEAYRALAVPECVRRYNRDRPIRPPTDDTGPAVPVASALALLADQRAREAHDQAPTLNWPPALTPQGRRGAPPRWLSLWRTVAHDTVDEAEALCVAAHNILTHARSVRLKRGRGYLIERSASYFSAEGDLSEEQARRALGRLMGKLLASRISVSELLRSEVTLRRLKRGQHYGTHWFLSEGALIDLSRVLGLLRCYGIDRPSTSRPRQYLSEQYVVLPTSKRHGGSHRYVRCQMLGHEDRNPSAVLNETGSVYCFGCARVIGQWDDADGEPRSRPAPSQVKRVRFYRMIDAIPGDRSMDPKLSASDLRAAGVVVPAARTTAAGAGPGQPPPSYMSSSPASHQPSLSELGSLATLDYRAAGRAGDPGVSVVERYFSRIADLPAQIKAMPTTCLADTYTSTSYVRPVGLVKKKTGSRGGMISEYAASQDLLDVLRSAERGSNSPVKYAKAVRDHVDALKKWSTMRPDLRRKHLGNLKHAPCDTLPDRYVTLAHHRHTALGKARWRGNRRVADPRDFKPVAASWVGIDIDSLLIPDDAPEPGPWASGEEFGAWGARVQRHETFQRGGRYTRGKRKGEHLHAADALLEQAAILVQQLVQRHPDYTGRVAMVRTGPYGVQIVAELRQTRWNPSALWADTAFREQVERLAGKVHDYLRSAGCQGGQIDRSVFEPSRVFRLPGFRIVKEKQGHGLFRARLIYATP